MTHESVIIVDEAPTTVELFYENGALHVTLTDTDDLYDIDRPVSVDTAVKLRNLLNKYFPEAKNES